MKTVAIIQARMGSTRLPGKIMKTLNGRTVLAHVITRTAACGLINETVVATTENRRDDIVVTEAERYRASSFRGSEDDVLSRYYRAAHAHGAELVVRITSDCPLLSPVLLCAMLEHFSKKIAKGEKIDYLSNTIERTYPRGLDVEIFTFAALCRAQREAVKPYEREHVTPYFYLHPQLFAVEQYRGRVDLSAHRWTLDTEEDFMLLTEIYGRLGHRMFSTDDVLALLAQYPELAQLNAHVEQKKVVQ